MKIFYTDRLGVDVPGLAIIKAESVEMAEMVISKYKEENPHFYIFLENEITEIMEYSGLDNFIGDILIINGGVNRNF